MIVICIFISLTIISAMNYFKSRRKRALITNLSGPLTLPLIGSVHKFLLLTPKNFLSKSHEYLQQFGSLSRCWVFDRLFILTADYEFVTQLLQNAEYLNTGYNNLLQPVYGGSLVSRDGIEWQQRRHFITHALRPEILTDFVKIFEAQAHVLTKRLRGECDGKNSFDIQPYVERAVLDVLVATAVGVEGRAQTEQAIPVDREYAETVLALIQLFTSRFLSLHSANPTIYSILCPLKKRRQRRLLTAINGINNELIAEQRAAANAATNKTKEEIYTIQVSESRIVAQTQQFDTLLKVLLAANIAAGEQLSNAEICDELNAFIFQGCLLTPAAISFTLVMISRHPSVQQKVFEELREVWPKGVVSDYTIENLMKLKYLENVINETLRLYPPQPIIARDLKQNFNYTTPLSKDAVMPAESEVYINVFEMLRQSESFTDPERFWPERHSLMSPTANTDKLAWGLGPRTCVAQKYTMLLMKSVIAQLLLAYEILPFGRELRLEVKIVLSSSSGWQLALRERVW